MQKYYFFRYWQIFFCRFGATDKVSMLYFFAFLVRIVLKRMPMLRFGAKSRAVVRHFLCGYL
jgi:hypothetical protein